ncbi:hypothetical protein K6W21_01590 [Burkholderia latens]|uniref:hypothetical protein n=1 Tax=Burkholderia latens TaxID=488446 RepID=UPI001C98AE8A|nr:hypothetical protein [Burkholderia latens]MBY4692781.1 hypothetical protein [Burkholderia latens]
MIERPILFSGSMVRAILEGRKTQTRRVVKLPHTNSLGEWEPTMIGGEHGGRTAGGETVPLQGGLWHTRTGDCLMSPHGEPGDRLWVRETWSTDFARHYPCDGVWYAADNDRSNDIEVRDGVRGIFSPESNAHVPFRWRPSIHMPRALSRITLEITGVRIERLQEISESDARAEGVTIEDHHMRGYCAGAYLPPSIRAFHDLWDSLNSPRGHGWGVNPWVWVVEFRRVA